MNAEAYARQLRQLLPPGRLWRVDSGSFLSRFLLGVADGLARVEARARVLEAEWDPRSAEETLPEWERTLGLPEEGQAIPPSVAGREAAIVQKYLQLGGATAAYFIGVAARLGYTATVNETGEHEWTMNVWSATATTTYEFRIGSRIGDRLSGRSSLELERVINRLKPAHTVCLFVYSTNPPPPDE